MFFFFLPLSLALALSRPLYLCMLKDKNLNVDKQVYARLNEREFFYLLSYVWRCVFFWWVCRVCASFTHVAYISQLPGLVASFPVGVGVCLEPLAMPSPNWQGSNRNPEQREPWLFGLRHIHMTT